MRNSDVTVVVTEQLANEFKGRVDPRKLEVIYTSVRLRDTKTIDTKLPRFKERYGLHDKLVLIYNGSLGAWNDPQVMASVFRKLGEHRKNLYLLVLTVAVSLFY